MRLMAGCAGSFGFWGMSYAVAMSESIMAAEAQGGLIIAQDGAWVFTSMWIVTAHTSTLGDGLVNRLVLGAIA